MPKTFNGYMDNPSDSPSVYTMRSMYRNMYRKKFDELLVREQGKIFYKVYRFDDGPDTRYILFKIPSESIPGLYYDTVVKLWAANNSAKNEANLRNYYAQYYSNDPAFVYTFAYSFNRNHLFMKELSSKMSKIALTQSAQTKNPKNEVWYVKSLVFAYYTMERYHLFDKPMNNQLSVKYNQQEFMGMVASVEHKATERERLVAAMKTKQQKEKEQKAKEKQLERQKFNATSSTRISQVNTVSRTKSTSRVKQVSRKAVISKRIH